VENHWVDIPKMIHKLWVLYMSQAETGEPTSGGYPDAAKAEKLG